MAKFADDTYLLVSAKLTGTIDAELDHIEKWSTANNLSLNRLKSREIIFTACRSSHALLSPVTPGIVRVSSLKCLGVTLTSNQFC